MKTIKKILSIFAGLCIIIPFFGCNSAKQLKKEMNYSDLAYGLGILVTKGFLHEKDSISTDKVVAVESAWKGFDNVVKELKESKKEKSDGTSYYDISIISQKIKDEVNKQVKDPRIRVIAYRFIDKSLARLEYEIELKKLNPEQILDVIISFHDGIEAELQANNL